MTEPENKTPDHEAAIAALVASGFTREAAEAIAAEYGDMVELADDDLDITVEDES